MTRVRIPQGAGFFFFVTLLSLTFPRSRFIIFYLTVASQPSLCQRQPSNVWKSYKIICKATQVEFQYALPRRIFRDNWRRFFSTNCVLCVRNRFLYFLKLILTNRVEAAAEETHLERNQQLVPKAVNFFEEILSLCPTVAWCTQRKTIGNYANGQFP